MNHNSVHDIYKRLLPGFEAQTELWFPNGWNSIRVRFFNGRDYIFTIGENDELMFEEVGHFLKRMEKERVG